MGTRRRTTNPLVKAAELSIAAPQVIALRTAQMAAGQYGDGREVWRMGTEKVHALQEATQGMALQLFRTNAEWPLVAMRQWWLFWQRVWLPAPRLRLGSGPRASAQVGDRNDPPGPCPGASARGR